MARAAVVVLGTTFLLSGCVAVGRSGPTSLGANVHRSIKDDPAPEAASPPRRAPPKAAVVLPPPRPKPPRTAAPKRTDAPTCASGSECMVRLKAMIDDPSRGWIGQAQPPLEYANGTRLFAYRALRGQLTCPQLGTGLDEIVAAGNKFRTPMQGVSALQANRVLALNSAVEQELRVEVSLRCKN